MGKMNVEKFNDYLAYSIHPERHNVVIYADTDLQEQLIKRFKKKCVIDKDFSFKFVELDGLEIMKDSIKLESGLQTFYKADEKRKPTDSDIDYCKKRNIDLSKLSYKSLLLLREELWKLETVKHKCSLHNGIRISFLQEYLANAIYKEMTNSYPDTLKEKNAHNDILEYLEVMKRGDIEKLLHIIETKDSQFYNYVSLIDYMKYISNEKRKRIVTVIKNADYILDFELQCVINDTMANQRSGYLNMNLFCKTTPYHVIVDDRFQLEEGHDIQTHNVRLEKEFYLKK